MFIEQRIYTFNPGKLPAWLSLYEAEAGPVSARHTGPLLGFFTTEVGPLNKVVFMRGYDDIDDRERGLASRDKDPGWAAFRAKSGQLGALQQQENKLLKTVPFSPMQKAAGFSFDRKIGGTGMVVDHRTYDFHPGKMHHWLNAYEKYGLPVQNRLLGQLLFMAVTEVGPINQVVFAWAYEGLGDRERRRTAMAGDPGWGEFLKATADIGPLKQQTNMILKPTHFSPIK